MNEWTKVASPDDIKTGDVLQVYVGDEPVVLANVEGEFFAISDVCSHEYVMLSEGWLEDDEIECPQHGSRFSMKTGEVRNLPATKPVPVYEVKIEDHAIWLRPSHKTEAPNE